LVLVLDFSDGHDGDHHGIGRVRLHQVEMFWTDAQAFPPE
jgi:hypothetical protein